jgi:transglutaminase-like putative cysteine protease
LVTVGILSVVVAAWGVAPASLLNLLAIPLSALGGYWSWRRRHQPNVTAKFVIALGMLMALGFFLARLLGEATDIRIKLAELLIHLQVLHSFDMPRRKDLGYSVVIGLILLGVAATISQTLALAPLVLLFLAIALPVLILDYRSRLGLRLQGPRGLTGLPTPGRLVALVALTVAIGLGIFAALPRFPGYQIRNFPVSANIDVQGDFTGEQIFNPDDEDGTGAGSGDIQGGETVTGPGELDGTYYYGFSQRMNQNLRGSLTPRVLLRVRSQSPGFWRVMSFDRYTGQGWEVSRDDRVEILDRSFFSYQTVLPESAFRPGLSDTELAEKQEVIQTYTVTTPLPNLLPALYQARRLYFPTRQVAIDAEGGLRSPLPLSPGLTYTVVSQRPQRDRTLLGQAGTDYRDAIREQYLQVPPAVAARVRETAAALIATSPQPLTNPYEKALFLAQSLKQNYSLQPELPFFDEEADMVEAFLYEYEGGYGDHFSTVLTVMLRSLGIPARLVAGFGPGEFNPFTGYYIVRNTDAYAMTEVFFPGYGWYTFDPIPTHEVLPPEPRQSQTFSVLRQFWNWVAGWLPSPVTSWLSDGFRAIAQLLGVLFQSFGQGWRRGFLILLSTITVGFGGWLLWLGLSSWRRQRWLQQLPPMERLYQTLLGWLGQQGFPKAATQTPWEYAQSLGRNSDFAKSAQVSTIIEAYMGWRYGGRPQNVDVLQQQLKGLTRKRP